VNASGGRAWAAGPYPGPRFRFVEEIAAEDFARRKPAELRGPLLIKGGIRSWPAFHRWSFESLASLRRPDGGDVCVRFQDGLVEQGNTKPLPVLPVSPFLRELADESARGVPADRGLLPDRRRCLLGAEDSFLLDWISFRSTLRPWKYIADWPILHEFPELRKDFDIRSLWPGPRRTWEYVFIGPSNTVTGLHLDIHNNWFCQVRGSKELLLFAKDQIPESCVSGKYNLGSVLSTIDILRLDEQPREAEAFAKAEGRYVRAEAGDALYIPKGTWHAVVSREPSISLGVFGLTVPEILTEGAWAELKNFLHLARLYRWKNCICHEAAGI
jgi:lysine-specific demethylase 8